MPTTKRRPRRRSRPRRPTKKFCRMTSPEDGQSLIDQIDRRQTELLDQLAELNTRVESLLQEWTESRGEEPGDDADAVNPVGPSAPTFQLPAADAVPQEC